MSSTTDIKAKFSELKKLGLDLGSKIGAEQDAGSGGRVQIYRNGRIYWHPNTGAHEVHGGILTSYLEQGGPGSHPQTGKRHYGFPKTDETRTADDLYPFSKFEFGEIIFVRGVGGQGVFGDFLTEWNRVGREMGALKHPIAGPLTIAEGQAMYFERGCIYIGNATGGKPLTSVVHIPLIGRPKIIDPTHFQQRRFTRLVTYNNVPQDMHKMIRDRQPSLYSNLWKSRLFLERVSRPGSAEEQVRLFEEGVEGHDENQLNLDLSITFQVSTGQEFSLQNRALYNLCLSLPDGKIFAIAPHALYAKESWEAFGFIHVTDIHVAKRYDHFRDRLRDARKIPTDHRLDEAIRDFNNFNNNFRDLIRYANHLHDIGLLDVVLATGDLVDYAFEGGQGGSFNGGNYLFFEQLIRGQGGAPDGVPNEELRVPIFTTLGNHDYRLNPYELFFEIDVPFLDNKDIGMYSPFNLKEDEVLQFQGGKPKLSLSEGQKMAEVDINNARHSYDYYLSRINDRGSYITELGSHRVVMIDTRSDAGLPPNASWQVIAATFINYIAGSISEDTRRAIGGGPNLLGFKQEDVTLLNQAISNSDPLGLVIVGIHAPPINIEGSEFNHFFRESEHSTVDPNETYAFLLRNISTLKTILLKNTNNNFGLVTKIMNVAAGKSTAKLSEDTWVIVKKAVEQVVKKENWPPTGTKHFKAGGIDDLLDAGIARGETIAFLKSCAGVDTNRPVDLILCGHNHDRVEYRYRWESQKQRFLFFTDFYTSTPRDYYLSRKYGVDRPVHIRVDDKTGIKGTVKKETDHRFEPPLIFNRLLVPPYPKPLPGAIKVREWWEEHRPLILETAALGPLDHTQRLEDRSQKPETSFQGFRVFLVDENVIHRVHYVTLQDLHRLDFRLPWEKIPFPVFPFNDKLELP